MTEAHLKTGSWYRVSCSPHHSWDRKEKLVSTPSLDHQKMQFPKPGKYSIINKSATFAHFSYPYVNLLYFASFLLKSQQLFFLFFSKKSRILVKTRKITCLLTFNKYVHQLPWVDCAIVEHLKRKRNFNISIYFILNLSFFILSLNSSVCLGNNILPDMYSYILHLPKQIIKKS